MEGFSKLLKSGSGVMGMIAIIVAGYLAHKSMIDGEVFKEIVAWALGGNIAKRGLVDIMAAFRAKK